MNSVIKVLAITSVLTLIAACKGSEYQQLVESELATGVVHDSIMFGIHFGDTRKDFFTQSWELNKKGIIGHGPKNNFVQYIIKNEEGSNIAMLFYPEFDDNDQIRKMELEFAYSAWAPWNEQYQADSLLPVVRDTLMSWYPGNEFMQLSFEEETYWVKVDGNRRINMKSNGKEKVEVKIVDMLNKAN